MSEVTEPILSAETAIAALSSQDNQIRYYAAWWLGKHQVQESCMALCESLFDERYRVPSGGYPLRRQSARALGQLKNPQAVPALIATLQSNDLRLQEAVIQSLAAIGDPRAIYPLQNLLHSNGEKPLEALIEALATLQVWSVRPAIEPFIKHPSERVQCAAARYLYLLTQEPQYLELILTNLNHENMYVRWAAIFDLGAVCDRRAVEAILAAKVPNSLKLLNLKRILETLLAHDDPSMTWGDRPKAETSQLLHQAIDDLLIRL